MKEYTVQNEGERATKGRPACHSSFYIVIDIQFILHDTNRIEIFCDKMSRSHRPVSKTRLIAPPFYQERCEFS